MTEYKLTLRMAVFMHSQLRSWGIKQGFATPLGGDTLAHEMERRGFAKWLGNDDKHSKWKITSEGYAAWRRLAEHLDK